MLDIAKLRARITKLGSSGNVYDYILWTKLKEQQNSIEAEIADINKEDAND